ncbi:MAG TPA: proteasome subunit beta [Actinomycetota bacterium]
MIGSPEGPDWATAAFAADPNPSFADLIRKVDPGLLPTHDARAGVLPEIPHGTTILALRFDSGIVMAGDRRATEGMSIADRRMQKVFPADSHSAVAIAGAAGPAIDLVRLMQVELEHYEKLEGESLSLEGKSNRLAQLIKQNFPMALQGLVVVPIFAGYDRRRAEGRIFRYDAVGGRYEETEYHATGSGGVHARGTIKKRFRGDLSREDAIRVCVEALMDAGDEDAATGGPDLGRGIFPVVAVVTAEGYAAVDDGELRAATESLLQERGR